MYSDNGILLFSCQFTEVLEKKCILLLAHVYVIVIRSKVVTGVSI